ncbi:alkene reductase [Rhizobium sp. Root1204]|uniref:alkene reductase n=1 Tax=Rhizobium sp. Root1204 TaxID=1736428 RepID=UPI00071585D6|nr:alkene reductase [Rhizobium sp. Root1204]KQV37024.1 alkene reductase [Rhizobium sp. Root1204]
MATYFDPLKLGDLRFANRVWMPPMTRSRATAGGVPVPLMAEYYRQRATAGLIISEGTYINDESCAFDRAPGIFTDEQVEMWKQVTAAVHDAGGLIFCQLWHCGRIGTLGLLGGREPLSPSGVNDDLSQIDIWGLLANGNYVKLAATPSRAMTIDDIERTIADYARAAANARRAGFDGVEIHAANGYLPHQFLSPTLNVREDRYGGSQENRARFVIEAFEAIAAEYPKTQIGIRVSPFATYNNTRDPDPTSTYSDLARRLEVAGAGYIHAADQNGWFGKSELDPMLELLRPNFSGVIVANGAITVEKGVSLLESGIAQAITFGRPFIANPDLVERISQGAEIAEPRPTGWYVTGADGYTDYPTIG